MHRLTRGRMTTSSTRNEREETWKRVHNAIAITSLLGLTWVFGLLSLIHEDSSFVFQVFFCIFNSLQGVFIFVMFCVRQAEVVAIWKEWISCGKLQRGYVKADASQSADRVKGTDQITTSTTGVASSKL